MCVSLCALAPAGGPPCHPISLQAKTPSRDAKEEPLRRPHPWASGVTPGRAGYTSRGYKMTTNADDNSFQSTTLTLALSPPTRPSTFIRCQVWCCSSPVFASGASQFVSGPVPSWMLSGGKLEGYRGFVGRRCLGRRALSGGRNSTWEHSRSVPRVSPSPR